MAELWLRMLVDSIDAPFHRLHIRFQVLDLAYPAPVPSDNIQDRSPTDFPSARVRQLASSDQYTGTARIAMITHVLRSQLVKIVLNDEGKLLWACRFTRA